MTDVGWKASGSGGDPLGPWRVDDETEVRAALRLLRKWWWLFVVGATLATGVSLLISRNTEPIYETSATIYVQPTNSSGLPSSGDLAAARELAKQLATLVTIRDNLVRVSEESPSSYTPAELQGKIAAQPLGNLLLVNARDPDPAFAAALADTTAQVFIDEYRTSQLLYISQFEALLAQYGLSGVENVLSAQVAALGGLRLVESAAVPTEPISPRPKLDALLSAIVGLLATGLLVVAIERVDDRVRSPARLQEFVRLPLLGAVGRRRVATLPADIGGELTSADEGWRSQFAFIYTNIEFALLGRGDEKVLLVTSPRPRDGKTTVAMQVAVAAATAGDRVVLVDLDLRAPSIHRLAGRNASPGFTTVVLGNASLEDVLLETAVPNLKLVTSGPVPPHPSAVLHSEGARRLIDELKSQTDLVVLDSPPCLAAPDALLISTIADGTVLVANARTTRRGMLTEARRIFDQSNAYLVGTVLNYVNDDSDSYYSYGYGDINGHSNGHGVRGKLKRWVGLGAK